MGRSAGAVARYHPILWQSNNAECPGNEEHSTPTWSELINFGTKIDEIDRVQAGGFTIFSTVVVVSL